GARRRGDRTLPDRRRLHRSRRLHRDAALRSRHASVLIRDARPEDRDAIRETTLAAYQEYASRMPGFWEGYRQNIVASLDEAGDAEQLVAVDEGVIVGTVLLYPPRRMKISRTDSLDMPWPEVRLLAVSPAARGRGVGAALMRECARRVREAGGRVLSLHTT